MQTGRSGSCQDSRTDGRQRLYRAAAIPDVCAVDHTLAQFGVRVSGRCVHTRISVRLGRQNDRGQSKRHWNCSSMTPGRTSHSSRGLSLPGLEGMAVRTRWSDASVERRTLRASVLADPVPVLDLSGFFEVGRWADVVTLYVWALCWGPFSPNLGPVGPGVAAGAAGVARLIPSSQGCSSRQVGDPA